MFLHSLPSSIRRALPVAAHGLLELGTRTSSSWHRCAVAVTKRCILHTFRSPSPQLSTAARR
uniref:Uncharacterized protein n=1 Tax=Oryza nivara TaxID=4536 RepID=A0A0E0IUX8_ORYNI